MLTNSHAEYFYIKLLLSYCFFRTRRKVLRTLRVMGCSRSKPAQNEEANDYDDRKNNGFKDPGLQKHMDECNKQKKKLRKVEDPEVARKKKIQQIQVDSKEKENVGPLGITQNELQNKRNNLKKAK